MAVRIIEHESGFCSHIVEGKDFYDSSQFYKNSISFIKGSHSIKFAAGFSCHMCTLRSHRKGDLFSTYCYVRKRMVDLSQTCDLNTRSKFKNVNFPTYVEKKIYG
jgi:hypothetical protein